MRLVQIAIITALIGGLAHAETKAGVTMPDTATLGGKTLVLNGLGLREATILNIDVYVAGLYVEAVSSDPVTLLAAPGPKMLVLRFVRDVDRKDILKAWNEGFKSNATVKLATIQPQIDQLNAWMGDFADGSSLIFSYVPATGVEVVVGRTRKGVLAGDDFARSLFAIWLGPNPPTKALKRGLLGKH
jgi:hypothetical protein